MSFHPKATDQFCPPRDPSVDPQTLERTFAFILALDPGHPGEIQLSTR